MDDRWLNLFHTTADALCAAIPPLSGTAKGAKIVKAQGAGGDESIYMDDLADRTIRRNLRAFQKAGGRFSLLSEESGLDSFGADWPLLVVDPIDGSANAKHGLPFFAVSFSLFEGPTLADQTWGYVANLRTGERFWARRGTGKAWYNGERIRLDKRPVKSRPDMVMYEMERPPQRIVEAFFKISRGAKCRSLGALALEVAYVANGVMDIMLHFKTSRILDFAGAKVVLEEAGGVLTDEAGRSVDGWKVDLKRKGMLVAAADEKIHKMAIKAVQNS